MKPVVIKNPVINSPFLEPQRHFEFTDDGITDRILPGRRRSEYFIPIPKPKVKTAQQVFLPGEGWTSDRIEPNSLVNEIRERVALWRAGGYPSITTTTRRLLEYWQRPDRERRLFFCQIEALETIIYITEAASKHGDAWIENRLRAANDTANPALYRIAFKMATGSGKTVVMAMLIAWHTLNKLANSKDPRFSDAFLLIAPGITIRDRLRVLLPHDKQNYYRQHDIVPPDLLPELNKAKIVITNFHTLKLHERNPATRLTKDLLAQGAAASPFTETPDQMARRVCRELGTKKNILVINDEAHHCYRRRPDDPTQLSGEDRAEAEKRNEDARVWISGLEAIKDKIGVKVVYDLSATPFFLRGSGYTKLTADGKLITEGILFPWVVSDFSLIDAIEAGIVKVPRVPVADDAPLGSLPTPTYRELWQHIREQLPKKKRSADPANAAPEIPGLLEGALHTLYTNYEQYYQRWQQTGDVHSQTPPVFIVVCNNTTTSKLIFDYIAGWEKKLPDGSTAIVPGALPLFSNVDHDLWTSRPNTILVDSEQLESGEVMSADFKKIAAFEIDEFKAEYRARFPGRDADRISDEDLLREVMNTVGKPGKLGERVKCVVSVSMLTEGWDANTVTHILGVRAFGTQLLCEQVVGRALRRMSYDPTPIALEDETGSTHIESFEPEYAEVYGVPFSFIPTTGEASTARSTKQITHVRAMEDRLAAEIAFPRILGYHYDLPAEKLEAVFTAASKLALSPKDIPTETHVSSILGENILHTLDDLQARRLQEIDFHLARRLLETRFRDPDQNPKPWLFPQLLKIVRRWREECLICYGHTFPQLLLIAERSHEAVERIYKAIVASTPGEKRLLPTLASDPEGSTRYVSFDTTRDVYKTDPSRCHISHVVLDSGWEKDVAYVLEQLPSVQAYVKNQGLGFNIPYTYKGQPHNYLPDFIVRLDDGHGPNDLLNLIIEVSGEPKPEKAAKTSTARSLWVPAVNNAARFGRWAFVEITDPYQAEPILRAAARGQLDANLVLFDVTENDL